MAKFVNSSIALIHWIVSYPVDNIIHPVDNEPFFTMWSYKITTIQGEQTSGKSVPACTCGLMYMWTWVPFKLHFRSFPGFVKRRSKKLFPPPISRTLCVLPVVPTIPEISFGSQIFGITSEGGPLISVRRPKFAVPFFTNRAIALLLFNCAENSKKE